MSRDEMRKSTRKSSLLLLALVFFVAASTFGLTRLLIDIYGHQQESRRPFVRLMEVNEFTSDTQPWGINWPRQYDSYLRTAEDAAYGGSSAMPAQQLENHPWLKRMYSGYAFALDYREARGHAYMLSDQLVTRRVTEKSQPGSCLHCHSSIIPTYRRIGLEAMNEQADSLALASEFNWPAVFKGFEIVSAMEYPEAYRELEKTPDGTGEPEAHPVGCLDCHDPETMKTRVTRPGFVRGIAALAESNSPVPHLKSIESWRKGDRSKPYDPNSDATRQEMRTFVCAQCHVEYYCGPKETLFFPWANGLKVENIEQLYDQHVFPDGSAFYDWKHGETGAAVYKAQHPEFELWSQGIHASRGVGCADCHMPFHREGAMKVSSHWVRSPLQSINSSCQTCHNVPEDELRNSVLTIQARNTAMKDRAANAMIDMLDAIREAQAGGATEEQLKELYELQKKAQWRLDFISSENSDGFHAGQEAARILGESIDFSRQAQAQALVLRAGEAPAVESPAAPVGGVTPSAEAPINSSANQ